jgi:hypothetical protein
METATDIASKTAQPFLEAGTLGATVVALALALVLVVIFMWRENKADRKAHDAEITAKDKVIFDLQEAWRNDVRTTRDSFVQYGATMDRALEIFDRLGRK